MVQWVQQPGWEGCCGPGQAGRMEAGPGPDPHLVMGLMHRQTRSIMAVLTVTTTNQVEFSLPAQVSVQCLSHVCLMSVRCLSNVAPSRQHKGCPHLVKHPQTQVTEMSYQLFLQMLLLHCHSWLYCCGLKVFKGIKPAAAALRKTHNAVCRS